MNASEVARRLPKKNKVLTLLPNSITFNATNLCGIKMEQVELSVKEILTYRGLLLQEGLLNEEDDLIEEIMKCDFYKQTVHQIILKTIKGQLKKAA